ncbi:hypothetical protein NX821_002247 [Clostridium septicum]|uniref:LamG-like jellyroll fold domain-containing protein n=1 Tax=Clostridium septicum TaxID=1504 RepID=UPI00321672DF
MNKKFISIILATIILVATCFNFKLVSANTIKDFDLNDSLLGYYTFENDSINNMTVTNLATLGEKYNGKLGSLNNNNGTNITIDKGILEDGLNFDGSESYFRVPNIINAKENYTVSLWLYNDNSQPTDSTSINIIQQTGAGRTLLYLKNKKYGSYVTGKDIISSKVEEYGQWQNVIITSNVNDDESITFKVYANGELRKEEVIKDLTLINGGITDLQFGCHKNTDTGHAFKGKIDSIRIYNKSADNNMVDALFNEHRNVIVFEGLGNTINLAEELLEHGILTDEYKEYTDLYSKVEEAKNITIDSHYSEIALVKTELEALINIYNETAKDLPVKISVNYNNIIKNIPDYMFGVNHRYHMDGYGSYNPETQNLYGEFKQLSNSANFGSVRYPGGIVANLFQWKRSIGDVENRITTIHGNWNEPTITPNFGLDEAARYIIDESNGEMIYVYGFGNGSALDAADLVEYLNCEVGENPNGGIDWAEVRANNGHAKPYNVKLFEIGNEVDEGRGYWMQNSPDQWSGNGLDVARMYAEGAVREFVKEKVAEIDNWNTSNDKSKASYFSDGTANQKKYMRYANDVTDQIDKSKAVESDSVHVYINNEEWAIVKDIKKADANARVVQVNYENGEILFGDGINGAIPPKNSDIRVSYTVYKDGLADYYEEMKKVDPDVKVYSGYSNSNIAQAIAESEKASKDGGKFDGVAVHPYSHSNGSLQDNDPLFYEKIMERIETSVVSQVRSRENVLKKYWPDGSKKVAISEFGIFNHPGDVVQSQTHAIYIAANIIEFMKFNTAFTNKHCLIDFPGGDVLGPGKQALIQSIKQPDGSYRFYGTPSLKVFSILNNMIANDLIETKIINNKKFYNNVDTIHAMTSKDKDSIYVLLINMDREENVKVKIDVNNSEIKDNKAEVMTLSGNGVYDVNSLEEPNKVDVVKSEVIIDPDNVEYEVPAHSVVGIKLSTNGEEVDKSALKEVIDYAEKLKSEGALEGVSPTVLEEFNKALEKANSVIADENTTQKEVDESLKGLQESIGKLEISNVNKEILQELVDKINGLNKDEYITSTWEVLEAELKNALNLLANKEATQSEVDLAHNNLNKAYLNLILIPDKSKLEELINKAEGIDATKYTVDSYKTLEEALIKAREIFNDKNATLEQVNKSQKELEGALKVLVKNSNNDIVQDESNKGNNSNNINKGSLPETGKTPAVAVGLFGLLISSIGLDLLIRKNK